MELNEIQAKSREGKILIIDARGGSDYMASHIPGSVSVPFSPYSWARAIRNWLNGQSPDIVLVAPNAETGSRGAQELTSVGLKVVHVMQDGLESWKSSGHPVASVEEITPEDLSSRLDEYVILDVREPFEWNMGTISNSLKIPMNEVPEKLGDLQKDRKYAVICAHGNRSEVVSVYLADNGFKVANVLGGMQRWVAESLPLDESY